MHQADLIVWSALLQDIDSFWQRTGQAQSLYQEFTNDQPQEAQGQPIPHGAQIIQAANKLAGLPSKPQHNDYLVSVMTSIQLSDSASTNNKSTASTYYPLKALRLSDDLFPQPLNSAASPEAEYKELWNAFMKEHKQLPKKTLRVYLDSLVYLLHKYGWSIPSSVPAVSLYDHSRVTAALAVCLYYNLAAQAGDEATKSALLDKNDQQFLLVEGDISGIQKFIYNPAFNGQELQDGMARRLRGRSFYLNLLLKTLSDYLIGELGLYSVNIIWATGGHLLIIAPNTDEVKSKLAQAQTVIQKWMWAEFRGALNIHIGSKAVTQTELKDFGTVKKNLSAEVTKLKQQAVKTPILFGETAPDEAWQDPWVIKMAHEVCKDTGRDLSEFEVEVSQEWQRDDPKSPMRSPQSLLFGAIGHQLIKGKTIQLCRSDNWSMPLDEVVRIPKDGDDLESINFKSHKVLIEFPDLKRSWLLSDSTTPKSNADLCLRIADHNNTTIDFLHSKNDTSAQGFELLATAVALDPTAYHQTIKEFDKLADAAEGGKFLGVLRMDVDNLGLIFSKGLPEGERSISKIANLSRMMEWFFTGYINTLVACKTPKGADPNLYTTYAGGDDLFIVGAWNEVLTLAERIQADFYKFCGKNPALHISGGIALSKGKFPIGRTAEAAGELLDNLAKAENKNALAFLEHRIDRDTWVKVRELGDKWIKYWEEKQISRRFFYNLLSLYRHHIDPKRDKSKHKSGSEIIWLARLSYSLARNVKDKALVIELMRDIPMYKDYIPLLAGYVLLITRS